MRGGGGYHWEKKAFEKLLLTDGEGTDPDRNMWTKIFQTHEFLVFLS